MKKISPTVMPIVSPIIVPTMSKSKNARSQSGFTLFVALLVSSLMLAIGFSIGNIILKQIAISSSGGGSLNAFYAADSAIECAMYWDRKDYDGAAAEEGLFGPTLDESEMEGTLLCGNAIGIGEKVVVVDDTAVPITTVVTSFNVDYSDIASDYYACARVVVTKNYNVGEVEGADTTKIQAEGYNTNMAANPDGDMECSITRPRVVGRGLLQTY